MIRRRPLPKLPSPRSVFLVGALTAASLGLGTVLAPSAATDVIAAPPALADRLEPRTWALAIPQAWIAAPLTGLREGDVLDVIATRTSERATATEVALGLRVMTLDERGLVVELTAEDAAAIAQARARGLSLVPILRSSR